ncbi:MAG: NEW3 domain-containing protein [Oligoflexia bacterium]|nr:NEW3 domain-containing protein [Oligoflexia bacterium]
MISLSTAGIPALATPALAAGAERSSKGTLAAQVLRAEKLTRAIPDLGAAFRAASPSERSARLEVLLAAIAERRALLGVIIGQDPGTVLRLALPESVRSGLPEEVQARLERFEKLQGKLDVRIEDYPGGKSRVTHSLESPGQRTSLHFAGTPPSLQSGVALEATGVRVDGVLALQAGESGETGFSYLNSEGTTSATAVSTAALADTLGSQRTLVVMVNFQDNPTAQPWSVSQVRNMVFTNVSDFMRENSYGQTTFVGDVSGWHTIAQDSSVCDSERLALLANQAAAAAGFDPATYRRFIYVYPMVASCGWSGMSTVGGNPSKSWINGKFTLMTFAHELGHAFGLSHSHALECGASTLGDACQLYEYGDHFDIMGNYTTGHFNAFQKSLLGWLGSGTSPGVATAQASGTFTLEPYESLSLGTKALRIPRGFDLVTGAQAWYYLEFRQALGADNFLAGNANILNGVLVHSAIENNFNSSNQLDTTPASQSYGWDDWEDTAIAVGASYIDSAAGVTITPTAASSSGITLQVTLAPASSCVRAKPWVALSPASGLSGLPGAALSYGLSITNQDSPDCPAASFSLQPSVPSGWSTSLGSASLTLAPGASGSTTLTVLPSSAAAIGTYPISVTATSNAGTAHSASASSSATVVSSLAMSVSTDKPVYSKGGTVLITIALSQGSVPVAGAGVLITISKPNGAAVSASVSTGTTGRATYKLRLGRKDPLGTYQVKASASSGGLSAQASTSFSVQ